jgi:K+-sensing histidine kinase KdpD
MNISRQVRWWIIAILMCVALSVNIGMALWQQAPSLVAAQVLSLVLLAGLSILILLTLRQSEQAREMVLAVSRAISSSPHPGDLLDNVVKGLLQLVPVANKCVIHLLDERAGRLYPRYSSQPDWEQTLGIPVGKGIAGRALRDMETQVIADVTKHAEFLPLRANPELRALMVAPLQVQGQPLGTISLNSGIPGAFGRKDKQLLTILAAQISIALYQSQLYESAMRESEYVDAIIHNLNDGVAVLDSERRLQSYNPSMAAMLGADVRALLGRQVSPESDDPGLRLLAELMGAPDGGGSSLAPRRVEIHEPVRAILSVSVSTVRDRQGHTEHVVLVHDQTAEQELIETEADIMRAAARELTPHLEAIRGYATLLRSYVETERPQMRRWLAEIQEKGVAMQALADDLEALRLIHQGALPVETAIVALPELLNQTVTPLQPALAAKGVHLSVTVPASLPDLPLDARLLRHALRNLLRNALDRAPAGGRITLQVEASLIDITVKLMDDGAPITALDRHRVLHGLYHANGASPAESVGTGVGLYVSRRLIEAQGGHLWAPEEGAKFQFVVPLPVQEAPDAL